jgi:hypothetical protein
MRARTEPDGVALEGGGGDGEGHWQAQEFVDGLAHVEVSARDQQLPAPALCRMRCVGKHLFFILLKIKVLIK